MRPVKRLRDDGQCEPAVETFDFRVTVEKVFSTETDADKAVILIQAALRQYACPKPPVVITYSWKKNARYLNALTTIE